MPLIPANIKKWFRPVVSNLEETKDDFVQPRRNGELPFNRLSSILPYTAYDEDNAVFVIEGEDSGKIEGLGFVIEIAPQIGSSAEMADFMTNLFPSSVPQGTGFQIQMFGTPVLDQFVHAMIGATLDPHAAPDPQQAELLRRMSQRRADYYMKGARTELFDNFNYRLRNYRANISVVVPTKDAESAAARREVAALRQNITTTLNQYNLYGYDWKPDDLINYAALILNPHRMLAGDHPWITYDDSKPIKDQIIAADTMAVEDENEIVFDGAGHAPIAIRAMSVRNYPSMMGLNNMGQLLGSTTSTAIAYPCPFLITCGITLPNYEAEKNSTIVRSARAQQTAESQMAKFLPHLQDVNEDWKIAQRAFDEGQGNCKLYHQVLLFADPEDLQRCEQAAKAVWRAERFDITTDRKMQKQALLASLPMLFGPLMQRDLKTAHRISTKTVFNAANMIPIIGEWTGTPPIHGDDSSVPVLTLFGRKGQAMGLDIFANPSGNFNGCVIGTSGSGKSFLLNELTQRTLAVGGRVWIIDVGRSYEKLANMIGGQYIEFNDAAKISLNPFSMVDDIDKDMEMLKPLIAQMISPSRPLSDYELAQVEVHIRSVWLDHMQNTTITHLAESLKNNCSQGGPNPQGEDRDWQLKVAQMSRDEREKYCDPRIRDLGVQLFSYTEDGAYGRYFDGPMNINFRSNFIVLELEELKSKKDLQAVVMLLLMYRITQDMYLSERTQKKLVIIDEAWDLMGTGNSGTFIEAGYRRARKYGGAFFTATQSVADYFKSSTAQAALENADWMFLLRQKAESIEAMAKSDKLVMDDSTKSLLRSVTTSVGHYSEVFVRAGDLPPSVGRLFADPFSLLTASSRADDYVAVRRYVTQGMGVADAVEAVLADRASKSRHRTPALPAPITHEVEENVE